MSFELPDELKFLSNSRVPVKTTDETMKGKMCVITGATSGVGLAAAQRIADAGAKIVVVARNQHKAAAVCEDLATQTGRPVPYVLADFADLDQVRRAASELLELCPSIHVLINSIGVHVTTRTITDEGFETVFCVNHLAPFLLVRLLWDRMIESAPSRIIYVNSEGHRFNGLDLTDLDWRRRFYTGLRSYGASKSAQILTMLEFADRLEGSGVTINAMHPGAVRTAIGTNNGWLYRTYQRLLIWPLLKEPAISGDALYYLAAAPKLAETSGLFFNLTTQELPARHALDRDAGKEMLRISERLVGLEAFDQIR